MRKPPPTAAADVAGMPWLARADMGQGLPSGLAQPRGHEAGASFFKYKVPGAWGQGSECSPDSRPAHPVSQEGRTCHAQVPSASLSRITGLFHP